MPTSTKDYLKGQTSTREVISYQRDFCSDLPPGINQLCHQVPGEWPGQEHAGCCVGERGTSESTTQTCLLSSCLGELNPKEERSLKDRRKEFLIINMTIINITTIITTKVRGEGRTEDKSSNLTGLNLIYPGLLVFYVEVFLHCAFSNVSSSHLPERMHSHIDCICLTFLRCVFSNVSSNGLSEKRHSHIACICLTFRHCVLPPISCTRRCILTFDLMTLPVVFFSIFSCPEQLNR